MYRSSKSVASKRIGNVNLVSTTKGNGAAERIALQQCRGLSKGPGKSSISKDRTHVAQENAGRANQDVLRRHAFGWRQQKQTTSIYRSVVKTAHQQQQLQKEPVKAGLDSAGLDNATVVRLYTQLGVVGFLYGYSIGPDKKKWEFRPSFLYKNQQDFVGIHGDLLSSSA